METNGLTFYEDAQAIGTQAYHRTTLIRWLLSTDGVVGMCQNLGCFWAVDVIASHLKTLCAMDVFFVVYAILDGKGGCKIIFDDGNGNIKLTQKIKWTNLEVNLKMFLQFDKATKSWVLMLPSEY